MTSGESAAQAAVGSIWARHRGAILAQVDVVERAAVALERGELAEPLRAEALREAHKLAGSLGTFGFAAASECARDLEALLGAPEPAEPGAPPRAQDAAALVARLRAGLDTTPWESPVQPVALPERDRGALVLVVEDDAALAERLAAEGQGRGLRVQITASPEQARVQAERERPDAVLLDLTFDGDTADAYELLSELSATVPVLVLTVSEVFTDRVEVARRGGRGFVPKTLAPRQVVDHVVQLLERTAAAATTVLAVDDDPALLDAIRALLEPHGLRVSTLADPLRSWQELERVRPDLLLFDVDMPEVGGIELCRVVRNDPRWAATPIIVLTSRRDGETVRAVFAAGADDYLVKPVIGEELVGRVANRLDRLRLHRFLTDRDALTGVLNRRSSTEGLDRLLRLSRRYEQPLTVAAIDLDRFKEVNDRRGHVAGDSVLRRLGELLAGAFRGEDVVGRWGGEEFVVGMYGMARADAVRRLRGLLAALGREEFRGKDERPFRVGFSAGVAQHPGDGADVAELYRAADAALYAAKAAGRGRVMTAGEEAGPELDVLLVEDDDAIADLVLDGLGLRGYRVHRLADGAEAAAALAGTEPSLDPRVVLLDLELPGLDGFELLRRLEADGALGRLRVIVLTGRAAEQDELRSLELGAIDHVTKPLSVPVLMHKVARALEGSVGPGQRE